MKANTGWDFPDLKDRSKTVSWFSNVPSMWNILMFLYTSKEYTMLKPRGTTMVPNIIAYIYSTSSDIRGLLDCNLRLSHHIRFKFKSDNQCGLSGECQCLWKHHTDNQVDATEQRATQTFKRRIWRQMWNCAVAEVSVEPQQRCRRSQFPSREESPSLRFNFQFSSLSPFRFNLMALPPLWWAHIS